MKSKRLDEMKLRDGGSGREEERGVKEVRREQKEEENGED